MNDTFSNGCPFCDTSSADDTFAESPHFRAIYNLAPILPGHSLVVPKRHVHSFLSLTDDEAMEMTLFSRRVVSILLRVFAAESFNWTIQEGEEAGQTVPHMHLHLIPRLPQDLPQPGDWYPRLRESQSEAIDSRNRRRLSKSERYEVVSRIRRAFDNPR